jgi:hypothetical protein
METKQTSKTKLKKKPNLQTESMRVHKNTKKSISATLAKINKKDFGRKVKFDSLFNKLLPKLNENDIQELRDESLTAADKIRVKYQAYCKENGPISQDEFALLMIEERDKNLTASRQKEFELGHSRVEKTEVN